MNNNLKNYFPLIRTREELLRQIRTTPSLNRIFQSWTGQNREEFLNFCTGQKGIKIIYDCFFKETFNPEYNPERLEHLLSVFMQQRVKIVEVLPNDTVRLADELTLLITDIIVRLEDGSLVNLEVQKIGYTFPGQRAACYSADALLRQYKRTRDSKGKNFTYRDIQKVYLIVLFETSPTEFKKLAPNYIHRGQVTFDTGLKMEMLQNYIFISLDIFSQNSHNNSIDGELEAWLTFLSTDEPGQILKLIESYPSFKNLYNDIYTLCQNTEKVMEMFSKELLELDRNTVKYMIDEMQNELDAQKALVHKQDVQLSEKDSKLSEKDLQISEMGSQISEMGSQISEMGSQISEKDSQISEMGSQISEKDLQISEKDSQLQKALARIAQLEAENKSKFPN